MFLPPTFSLFDIKGNPHQFGKVKDRKANLLSHLQIGLAETAGGHDTLGPRLLCHRHDSSHQFLDHIAISQSQVRTAAINLIRPFDGLGAEGSSSIDPDIEDSPDHPAESPWDVGPGHIHSNRQPSIPLKASSPSP